MIPQHALLLLFFVGNCVWIAPSSSSHQSRSALGRPCLLDGECTSTSGSVCGNPTLHRRPKGEEPKKCACKRHYHNYRNLECLPGQLLTSRCKLDSQCRARVASSLCVQGRCACKRRTVAFRLHTCVRGSSLGSICHLDDQCQLEDGYSFCDFVIKDAFGRCECKHGRNGDGSCRDRFEELGATCHHGGPCKGLKNSACLPDDDGEARCACAPGFMQVSEKVCEVPTRAHLINGIYGASLPSNRHSASPHKASVSLGYPCESTSQCQTSDPRSVCGRGGVCVCKSAKGAHREEVGNVLGKSRRKRRRRKVIKALYGDGQVIVPSAHADAKIVSGERFSRKERWFCAAGGRKPRLCPEGTFQCVSDGRCVSRFFLCDGKADCGDGSDEQCGNNFSSCPRGSFVCSRSAGRCLNVGRVCDGKEDCDGGEDEEGCDRGSSSDADCPETSFPCKDGEGCVPGFDVCNAIVGCRDGSDEEDCHPNPLATFFRSIFSSRSGGIGGGCPFRCKNGNCRALDVVCSGKDGCGDGSDEQGCQICRCPA